MKNYTFEEVAPFVISRQVVEEGYPVCWLLPDGTQVTDFERCVYYWVNFLNDKIREVERGY